MTEKEIYARGFKEGVEKLWKIVTKVDREHPEYPIPFELVARYRKLLGSVEDYLWEECEHGEHNEKRICKVCHR